MVAKQSFRADKCDRHTGHIKAVLDNQWMILLRRGSAYFADLHYHATLQSHRQEHPGGYFYLDIWLVRLHKIVREELSAGTS